MTYTKYHLWAFVINKSHGHSLFFPDMALLVEKEQEGHGKKIEREKGKSKQDHISCGQLPEKLSDQDKSKTLYSIHAFQDLSQLLR